MKRPAIVGVVNITTDSFSDGGKFLEPAAAIAHAEELLRGGAEILDLGAAASNPHAQAVSAQEEIARLRPVVAHLKKIGARISIDTTKSMVQRWALAQKVEFLNDIRGFPDESLYPEIAASKSRLVAMHFISDLEKAVREPKTVDEVWHSITTFFTQRLNQLERAGIARGRLIIDPGMGFFLASNPEPSLYVLSRLSDLKRMFGSALMVGVSRKSFLRNISEAAPPKALAALPPDIQTRTLAAELFAAQQGTDYIRTHDAKALHEGLLTLDAISTMLESHP